MRLRLALRWAARAALLALGCVKLLVVCSGALLALDRGRAALLGVQYEALTGVRFAALLTVRRGVLLTLVLVPAVLAWDVVTAAGTPSPGAITPYLDALDRWAAGPVCLAAGVIVARLGGVSAAGCFGWAVGPQRGPRGGRGCAPPSRRRYTAAPACPARRGWRRLCFWLAAPHR